ncbi:hypothetical protein Tco_0023118 [Tanacetum coccineum]
MSIKHVKSQHGNANDTRDKVKELYTLCFGRLLEFLKPCLMSLDDLEMIFRGKVFVLRAKEIPGWVPEFADEFDDDDESEEGSKGYTANRHGAFNFDDADDVDKVPETELDDPLEQNENSSKDPFGIYYLTKNKDNDC